MKNYDEEEFHKVCNMLQKKHVNFWICHGTLLGIIREGRLLPWDHDIDFAVWDCEITKDKIIKIFFENGYEEEKIFGDMDCLHFIGKNKKIDVSFYKTDSQVSSIKWAISPNSFISKILLYCIRIIWVGSDKNVKKFDNYFMKVTQIILNKASLVIAIFLPKTFKKILFNFGINMLDYIGYSYPNDLMKFRVVEYNNTKIKIPFDAEKCLELTYGKDWKTPKKKYVWHEEAENLIEF